MRALYTFLIQTFLNLDFQELYARILAVLVTFLAIVVVAIFVHWITKLIVVKVVHRFVEKTKTEWDDYLMKRKVFQAMSHITSAMVFYYSSGFSGYPEVTRFISIFTNIYFVIIFIKVASGALRASNDIYLTTPYAATRSIKGYIQLLMILVYFISGIFIIAFIFDKSPLVLFGGLSAVAAVLLIVFKDTILGLVASIQLSANKMLKPGDWIEIPKLNTNGTVIDISLNTVKVQNFDNTISTIPTYSLVSDSFVNWSGMEESDGRRIKRSINIDMKSVRFCEEPMLDRLKNLKLIKNIVIEQQYIFTNKNNKAGLETELISEEYRPTNLGIFRKYLEEYLKNYSSINKDMTILVRQLQSKETGIPIEIYAFSKEKRWIEYEAIQDSIFEHILAVIPVFGLQIFQLPSGHDVSDLTDKISTGINPVKEAEK